MRFMVLVKATQDSEAGALPDPKMLEDMGKFNDELIKAGVLVDADGLQPTAKGARVTFSGKDRTVSKGPFHPADVSELVAGFWLWELNSMEEAIEWVKRCPNPMPGDSVIEIRQVIDEAEFAALLESAKSAKSLEGSTPG